MHYTMIASSGLLCVFDATINDFGTILAWLKKRYDGQLWYYGWA